MTSGDSSRPFSATLTRNGPTSSSGTARPIASPCSSSTRARPRRHASEPREQEVTKPRKAIAGGARRHRCCDANGFGDRRRYLATQSDRTGGARQLHPWFLSAAPALVHERVPGGDSRGLQYLQVGESLGASEKCGTKVNGQRGSAVGNYRTARGSKRLGD